MLNSPSLLLLSAMMMALRVAALIIYRLPIRSSRDDMKASTAGHEPRAAAVTPTAPPAAMGAIAVPRYGGSRLGLLLLPVITAAAGFGGIIALAAV